MPAWSSRASSYGVTTPDVNFSFQVTVQPDPYENKNSEEIIVEGRPNILEPEKWSKYQINWIVI